MSLKFIFQNTMKNKNKLINERFNLSPKNKYYDEIKNDIPPKFNTIGNNCKNILLPNQDNLYIKNNIFFNNSTNIKNESFELNSSKSKNKIFNNYSTISNKTTPLNLKLFRNNSLNKRKIYNKSDYININSLFTLPIIEKKINRYNSIKTIFTPNYNFILNKYQDNKRNKIRLNLVNGLNISLTKLKKNSKYDNLSSFMKFKYYEDINEKLEKKLRDDSFLDRGVKDKIIKMGKVGVFWNNVIEYCSPFFFEEKYKNMKKIINNNNCSQNENNHSGKKEFKNILYTSILKAKIIHNQSRNKNKNLKIKI